jgi:hypothetical protein
MGRRALSNRSPLIGSALPRRHSAWSPRIRPADRVVGGPESRRVLPGREEAMQAGGTPACHRNHSVRPHRNGRREERQVPLHSNPTLRGVNFSTDLPTFAPIPTQRFPSVSGGRGGNVFSTWLDGCLDCGYSYSDINKNVSSAPRGPLSCPLSRLIGATLFSCAARPILFSFDSKSILSMGMPRIYFF